MLSEYVIWGKAPGAEHESLLVSEHAGLRDAEHALEIMAKLAREHGCTEMRIERLAPLPSAAELAAMFRGVVAA